jgi:nifR3 family TIM-barrel protein
MDLAPIRLGNGVTIAWPVALAPMAGVTNAVFRLLCREHGCGYTTTEFARDRALLMGVPSQVALIDIRTDPRPAGIQIFGADPDEMRRAAALVVERQRPDVVDINMGCPAPKVTNGQGGSSLLREPARAQAIVAAVAKEIAPVPVTVKLRVGWDEVHKASGAAVDVARRVVDAGAQLLTVHGRTREQRYEGEACWDTISAVAAAVPVPVIGNGDVASPQDAAHRLRTSGCAGISVGRGARGRPWLFRQIAAYLRHGVWLPEPGPAERARLGLAHLRRQRSLALALLHEEQEQAGRLRPRLRSPAQLAQEADRRALGAMLPHVMYYVTGTPGAAALRRALSQARSASELEDILAGIAAQPDALAAADPLPTAHPT